MAWPLEQPSLWERRTLLTHQGRFEEWLSSEDGREVEFQIVRRAKLLQARGWRRYGMKALWESIRYDRAVDIGPDADGWKLNNDFTSRMARHVMRRHPELAGFFETREIRSA